MRKAGCLLVLLTLSLLLAAQHRAADSVAGHQPAVALPNAASFTDIPVLNKWLSGVLSADEKDSARSLKLLTDASALAKSSNNLRAEGLIQRTGGQLFRQLRLYHRSFAWYLRSFDIFAALGDPYEIVSAELELAKSQYFRGNYRQSMQHYSHGVEVATANNIKHREIEMLEILGLLYNAFQNFSEGAAVFRKSLDMKYQLHDEPGILYTLEILSSIYYRNKKYDSSLMYATRSLKLSQKLQRQSDIELSRLNRGSALIRLKRMQEASEEIGEIAKLDIRGTNINLVVRYNVLAGSYYLAQYADQQAMSHYNAAIAKADLNLFPELYALIYNNMADSYFERGEVATAYQYSRKYTEMVADLYSGENVISLGNLEAVLKTDRSTDEILYLNNENKVNQLQLLREAELRSNLEKENSLQDSLLRKETQLRHVLLRENEYKKRELEAEKKLREVLSLDNTRQQDRLRSERNLRLLLLMAVTAMLALGVMIFSLYRKQRRKNAIILQQADDMQTLMKEIHHRVKNNLQVISSLLDLQALSIKHDQAAEAVKEGRNRVQSMALIHQNLYNEGNIKGIKVGNYIITLAEALFHSYNIKPRSVYLKTDIDDLNLDVDTVIPIGLILNELITNSLKHAFRNKEYGEIVVILKKEGEHLLLKVRDNGDGFPSGSPMQPDTFGLKLIRAFAQKLKAKLSIYNDGGACVEMHITRYKMAELTPVREFV